MYKIYPLHYKYDELEPFIDTHTIGLHYHKHQKNYLKNLNQLLEKNNVSDKYPIELLSYHINEFPFQDRENVLFNLGGVLNHIIYFNSISPKKTPPNELLKEKILTHFNSMDNLKKALKENALSIKGSGYTYLILDREKNLKILNFLNQDCPYFYELIPLLCIDVWEHSYYINYEHKRDLYIDNFFEIMDFKFANQILQQTLNHNKIKF